MSNRILETVEHDDLLPIKVIHFVKRSNIPAEIVMPHWHRDIELDYMVRGNTIMKIHGREQIVKAGEILLINSTDVHSSYRVAEDDEKESLSLLFDIDLLEKYCPGISRVRFCEHFSKEQRKDLITVLDKILCLEKEEKSRNCHKLSSRCLKTTELSLHIIAYLLEHCIEEYPIAPSLGQRKLQNVAKAIEYVNSNFRNEITLAETAAYCGVDPAYLSRIFHSLTGERFHNYVQIRRLDNAYQLLVNGDCTVTTATYESGFPNLKSFIETFKMYYKVTPGQYFKEK